MALQSGMPFPNYDLSPSDHIRVDKRAFRSDVHVKVKLEVHGYDRGLWEDLEEFRGLVVERYYQEVNGAPMFGIDFGGNIGRREVKVEATQLDAEKHFGGSTQRALDFGSHPSPSRHDPASQYSGIDVELLHPLYPNALLLSDNDLNHDWMGEFQDFPPDGMEGYPSSPNGSWMGDAMAELGIYNPNEDTSDWNFKKLCDDSQWQEPELTLLGRRRFTGPLPGPTRPLAGNPSSAIDYFQRFWPNDVLDRIIEETNR
jgi:hypothetical protein